MWQIVTLDDLTFMTNCLVGRNCTFPTCICDFKNLKRNCTFLDILTITDCFDSRWTRFVMPGDWRAPFMTLECITRKYGWVSQNAVPLKFDPKPLEAAFSAVFRTVITADRKKLVTPYPVRLKNKLAWMSVAKLFDCLLAGHVLLTFIQYIIAFCSWPEAPMTSYLAGLGGWLSW